MEISLILSDDTGSYSTILGQFLETAVAETLNDRILAQASATASAASATASQNSADQSSASAANAGTSATASQNSASASATSAAASANSQTTAATNATNAGLYATNAGNSQTAAAASATAASGSATAAANSATAAAGSASSAASTLANALTKANNLSDVASASTALANIGGATLAGSATQAFSVATATTANQATTLAQVQTLSQEYTVFLPTNTAQTLTSAVLGGVVYWYSATAGTLTLQQGSGAFQGAKLKIVNGNTGTVTVSTFSGDTMSILGTTFTSIALGPGDDLDLVRADTATRWDCVGGSARASLVALRVANATLSTHAINLGQQQARSGTSGGFSFRNKLHNSKFNVNQRAYVSATATTAALQFAFDRWAVITSGQSISFTAATQGSTSITVPAGGIQQTIPVEELDAGTYVVSWTGTATCTVAGTAIANGGTFVVATSNTANLVVKFINGTLTDPQIELGTVATFPESIPYPIDLDRCKRFYRRCGAAFSGSVDGASGGTAVIFSVNEGFYPEMRSSPTLSVVSGVPAAFRVLSTDVTISTPVVANSVATKYSVWTQVTGNTTAFTSGASVTSRASQSVLFMQLSADI